MNLPFSHDAFLDVFGAYNATWWPIVALLWFATGIIALALLSGKRVPGRVLFGLLAVHWGWSGVVYHWGFFRPINPAAVVFGAFFLVQAAVFAWLAFRSRALPAPATVRRLLGGAFVVYGVAYPFLNLALGLSYPRLPLFAVPCPTTLVTAGFLVGWCSVPRTANIIPILWAGVASSAALLLGIRADLALVPAGLLLTVDAIAPTAFGRRLQHSVTPREAASVR